MTRPSAVLTFTAACLVATMHAAQGASQARGDPALFAALRADRQLKMQCDCIESALWLNESYARIVVDGARFKNLDAVGRKRFAARALKLAEATYLTEFRRDRSIRGDLRRRRARQSALELSTVVGFGARVVSYCRRLRNSRHGRPRRGDR